MENLRKNQTELLEIPPNIPMKNQSPSPDT